MLTISFEELAVYLKQGREIEFTYDNKNYSVTNSNSEWHFCCDTDGTCITLCPFNKPDILVEKIRKTIIDGATIENIFNKTPGKITVCSVL
ncbi:MAG: hypothetical protein IJ362_00365 [Oscillospiraceae bacterium]|nr:hypothetical protein [Oscillospiraceae bacterium]